MNRVVLNTSFQEYEALHIAADTRAKSVRVDREVLMRLLIDHGNMYQALIELKHEPKQ